MQLTPVEQTFIERRTRFIRAWKVAGPLLLIALLGLVLWLLLTRPLMINPWTVLAALDAGLIDSSTLTLLAAMMPAVLLLCLMTVVVCLLLVYAALANERRYVAMIRRISGQ